MIEFVVSSCGGRNPYWSLHIILICHQRQSFWKHVWQRVHAVVSFLALCNVSSIKWHENLCFAFHWLGTCDKQSETWNFPCKNKIIYVFYPAQIMLTLVFKWDFGWGAKTHIFWWKRTLLNYFCCFITHMRSKLNIVMSYTL